MLIFTSMLAFFMCTCVICFQHFLCIAVSSKLCLFTSEECFAVSGYFLSAHSESVSDEKLALTLLDLPCEGKMVLML